MPDYYDAATLIVIADRPATISAPAFVSVVEGGTVTYDVVVYTGWPLIDNIVTFGEVLKDAGGTVVTEGGLNPTVNIPQYPLGITTISTTTYTFTVTVIAPTLPGDSPSSVDWLIEFPIVQEGVRTTATTRLRVTQSVPATINFPENVSAYEQTEFSSSELMYNAGSPVATEIRHSFHNSLADARAGRNPVTSNRPSATIRPTSQELSNLAGQPIRERDGTLAYGSALPAVSGDTQWYGRLEIVQNGAVADSTAYTLSILNAVRPSLSIVSGVGIEGTRAVFPMLYNAGAPFADRFNLVGFYNSQQDAQNNRNRLTSADGIPTDILWAPTTPTQRTGQLSGLLYMQLPYVTADKTIWALARLERDGEGGAVEFFQTTFYMEILDRVPPTIDVQEYISMQEESTLRIMFTYTRGNPPASGYGVTLHETVQDAENNRNPVMDADDPRITLSPYDNTGSYTAEKTGTATIVAPDVELVDGADPRWYPRFYMIADVLTPDP